MPEGSDYFQRTHKKKKLEKRRWEQLKIKLLPSKEDLSSNEEYEEPLIHISIWIRNDAIMNKEDGEVEGSRRSLPTKQIKISIQLSFHDIVLLCICLYSA